jgi:hypothetical protein
MKLLRWLATSIALMLVHTAVQADPYTGTWRLKESHLPPGVISQVLTISVAGEIETYQSDLVFADGRRQVTNYTARYDEQEYPSETVVTDTNGNATTSRDTVILRKVDSFTRERHWKQDGRLFRILERVASADGKTLTSRVIDVDRDGARHPQSVLVFERD